MKKGIIYIVCASLLLCSCGTYEGAGAFTGASFGSILGSAIGGIASGPRGSDIGTIVGMAGGAAVGAAIGSAADQAESQRIHDRYERIQQQRQNDVYATPQQDFGIDESGFDSTNRGDDRIVFTPDTVADYSAAQPQTTLPSQSDVREIPAGVTYTPNIEIANPRFVDDNHDGFLSRGESAKVTFEIYNRGTQTLYRVIPSVIETTSNRHIRITPSIIIESIAPGHGVVYTAFVRADKRLGNGTANFALAVLQGKKSISKVTEFTIRTRK